MFCFFHSSVFAENKDSTQIEALGRSSLNIVYSKPDSARSLINEALLLCDQPHTIRLFGLTYNYLGIYYDVIGDNDSAFWAYNIAAEYAIKQKNQKTLAATYNNIGLLHWNQKNLTEALESFFKASEIYEELNDEKGLGNTYSNLSLIFEEQRRASDALNYERKALAIRVKANDSINIGRSLSNIGIYLAEIGHMDSGIYQNKLAIPYFQKLNNRTGLANCYQNIGTDFHILNQLDSAEFYAKKALLLREEIGNKKYLAATYSLLGNIHQTQNRLDDGIAMYLKSEAIYKQYNVLEELWRVHEELSELYEAQGDYELAYNQLLARKEITDSIHTSAKLQKLYEVEEKYETEKTNRELAEANFAIIKGEQQSQKLLFALITGSLLTIGIILFFVNQIRKNKEAKKKDLLVQKLEISRELHDNIGSQLTYLNLKLEKLELDKSEKNQNRLHEIKEFAHATISDLRGAIWGLSKDISYRDFEMKVANEVQKIQREGLAVSIDWSCELKGIMNSMLAVNTFRIIQESIQNAVKHADASKISVDICFQPSRMKVVVKDNGKGFDATKEGFGLTSMKQRAEKITAKISVLSDQQGSQIILTK